MVDPDSAPLITSVPLTAEAREEWLHDLFADSLNHYGELFIPRDSFYSGLGASQKAERMLKVLCEWLTIKPGYISLEFESNPKAKKPKHYCVYIESHVAQSEFLLAAKLAIALTRYLLEEKKQIHLNADEQRALIATASVTFGLGIVLANGMEHDHDVIELLGPTPPSEYAAMVHGFTRQRSMPLRLYQAYLAPWAAELLDVKKPKRPSRAVAHAYANERHKRYQLIGIVWLLVVAIGIGGFVVSQRAIPESKSSKEAHENMDFMRDLYSKCDASYGYNKQFTDATDLQAERSLRAEATRCQSLKNEYESAQSYYNSLTTNN